MGKIKGPFAPIREGLLEHMFGITPMESKIYLIQHLMAIRAGPDRGKVFSTVSELSRIAAHKRESVRAALSGLEGKDFLKSITGGWLILNYDGDNPSVVASEHDAGTKRRSTPLAENRSPRRAQAGRKSVTKWPENGHPSGRKSVTKVAENRPGNARKAQKRKPLNTLVDVIDVKEDVEDKKGSESAKADSFPESWPSWYQGISWNKKAQKVEFTEEAGEALSEHLLQIANEESLPRLADDDKRRSFGRLNGYLLKPQNSRCRGPKSLAAIVVNWFENDLRDLHRAKASKASPAESYTQSEQEVYDSQRPEMTPELEKKLRESGERRKKYEADKLAKEKEARVRV